MWSNKYFYFNIQKNSSEWEYLDTKKVQEIFLKINHLEQINECEFRNNAEFPFIDITLANAINGDFSTTLELPKEINLISVVCSKNDLYENQYRNLLLKIASELNWKLFLEEDEEGNEQILF